MKSYVLTGTTDEQRVYEDIIEAESEDGAIAKFLDKWSWRDSFETVRAKLNFQLVDGIDDADHKAEKKDDLLVRTSITIPQSMLDKLEDEARANKRKGGDLKSVSAIIRSAVDAFM